jgi:alpha-L-fucosidase
VTDSPFWSSRRDFTRALLGGSTLASALPARALHAWTLPEPEQDDAGARFRAARFGLFVHFGLYAIPARGEWIRRSESIPDAEYRALARQFNPSRFSASAWVDLAQAAGQRYLTVTTKHHDGFCLFDSAHTDWKITRTPFGRDLIAELAEECHRRKLPLFLYYSLMDWDHPAYRESLRAGTPLSREFVDFTHAQVRELCTGYGPIAGLWFDGGWDHSPEQWRSAELLALIRQLQPGALVNDRIGLPADFSTPEQQFNARPPKGDNALREACMTINDNWGYAVTDQRFKSPAQLIQLLARAASTDANLLLNVGPRPDGTVQPEFVSRLEQVGEWLGRNGDSIYATRAGYADYNYGTASTTRPGALYFHIFDWPRGHRVSLDVTVPLPIRRCYALEDGSEVPYREKRTSDDGRTRTIRFELANPGWNEANAVLVVETDS